MAQGDVQIALPNGAAPTSKQIIGQTAILPKAVNGLFDGSGAGGPFLPCLVITGKEGFEVARIPAPQVAAGGSAEVSWFPRVGGAGGIQFDADNEGDWLFIQTNGVSPSGQGVYILDSTTGSLLILGPSATLQSLFGFAQVEGSAGVNLFTTGAGGVISLYNANGPGMNVVDAGTHSEVNIFGDRIGFFAAPAIGKPAVAGSRGGNAALGNLLTALANLGLITNNTTP